VTDLWMVPVAALLLAAAAELGARAWLRRRRVYHVYPPGLRLRLYPDHRVFPQLEPCVRFEVNRHGERGDEVPPAEDGLYRVLVAGGSQPEGYLLDQHTSWPGALQRLLETPENLRRLGAKRAHVGSVARSGIGSEALDLILQRILPRYPRLQTLVLLVGASDVLRWLEQGAPPSAPAAASTSDVFMCHPELDFRWRPARLALLELARRWRRRVLRPVVTHQRAGSWIGRARAMRARARVIRTSVTDPQPMLDHFDRHFRGALQTAMAHADRVIVVRQPWFDRDLTADEATQMWHGGVGHAWKEEVTVYYSHEVLARLMTLLDERAARVASDMGVEQIDLRPAVPPTLDTYYDFFHLTPAGAHLAAPAIASTILRRAASVAAPPALARASA
jgi:hypothetical protein